ncbi:MAG: hypothetical protein GY805_24265 [Chloroflexi bacterium]|nr:hypothetical protein [Chloroflexota bacterium]
MNPTNVYIILFVAAAAYALALNTKQGKTIAKDYTWITVVAGTSLVLAALWFLIPQDSWQRVVISFVVAGLPMIGRSLLNKR